MRQGQQNRRGRGRSNNNNNGNNNRKGHNPLTRSFESNGPDVKIRGTPAHIAEKYMSLARDAQSSGDPVLAENYLQHAEHYVRIILTFREQQVQQNGEAAGGVNGNRVRQGGPGGEGGEAAEDFGDDEGDDAPIDSSGFQVRGHEPQPSIFDAPPNRYPERQPGSSGGEHRHQQQQRRHNNEYGRYPRDRFGNDQQREPRPYQGDRQDRGDRGPRQDRYERPERPESNSRPPAEPVVSEGGSADVSPEPPRAEGRPDVAPRPPRRERFAATPQHEQPEFLRRPVRRPRREAPATEGRSEGRPNGTASSDDDSGNV